MIVNCGIYCRQQVGVRRSLKVNPSKAEILKIQVTFYVRSVIKLTTLEEIIVAKQARHFQPISMWQLVDSVKKKKEKNWQEKIDQKIEKNRA